MAWTDAARAAAAATRRLHSVAKNNERGAGSGHADFRDTVRQVSPKNRARLAKIVRSIRAGKTTGLAVPAGTYLNMAARSTAYRNNAIGGAKAMRKWLKGN